MTSENIRSHFFVAYAYFSFRLLEKRYPCGIVSIFYFNRARCHSHSSLKREKAQINSYLCCTFTKNITRIIIAVQINLGIFVQFFLNAVGKQGTEFPELIFRCQVLHCSHMSKHHKHERWIACSITIVETIRCRVRDRVGPPFCGNECRVFFCHSCNLLYVAFSRLLQIVHCLYSCTANYKIKYNIVLHKIQYNKNKFIEIF